MRHNVIYFAVYMDTISVDLNWKYVSFMHLLNFPDHAVIRLITKVTQKISY